jgi:nicotinamide mononucleotide transporter
MSAPAPTGTTGTDALNALEIMANVTMTLSIWLAARNNVHTWTTGIVGCLLFGVVFIRNQLFADATLQLFFVATSLVGYWQWLRHTSSRRKNSSDR